MRNSAERRIRGYLRLVSLSFIIFLQKSLLAYSYHPYREAESAVLFLIPFIVCQNVFHYSYWTVSEKIK